VEAQIHVMAAIDKDDHYNSPEIVFNKQTEHVTLMNDLASAI